MRAVAPPPPWLLFPGLDKVQLIHLRDTQRPAPGWAGLAHFPAVWSEVPHSRIQTSLQSFVSYHRAGQPTANYHYAALPAADPAARVIAQVNLGPRRVSVLPAACGYEARWTAGDIWHRISGGPVDLGGFMELVHQLRLT
ncbi:hypothetical protein Rhe02_91570 [Rhizocola hellebori]|uniref:Uncharacterized protein n=1 Tax=Rhizocola hellebori TaxID=1392758 RepID=A0A8J3QJW7_9ACTN|nr:hypothetical protein [Rhizocola hellebori]GIH11090.1 hypothetical protein Rhe02_91570 [Rhizocola hellebori]